MKKRYSMTPGAIRARAYRALRVYRKSALADETLTPPTLATAKVKGHSPWNDAIHGNDHDAGIPTDATDPALEMTAEEQEIHVRFPDENVVSRRADVVAAMQRTRNAPRGIPAEESDRLDQPEQPAPPYNWASAENAKARTQFAEAQEAARTLRLSEGIKARVCLTECAQTIADAIVRGARIIARDPEPRDLTDAMFAEVDERSWNMVGPGLPLNCWLETTRAGEGGSNICMAILRTLGDEIEWAEAIGGRTTVTHSTFAAPTHWRWPQPKQDGDKQ